MSRPKFQRQEVQELSRLLPREDPSELVGPSPWDVQYIRHQAALRYIRAPDELRPYYPKVDESVRRRLGRLRHEAYLDRTGGNRQMEADGVVLMWDCCRRDERLDDVHFDRHGNLRPEDRARIEGLRDYHQCASA